MSDTSGLLTVAAVAERLAVSRAMVYRLVDRGDLPAHRIGRAVRVPLAGLDAYLSRCKVLPFPAHTNPAA